MRPVVAVLVVCAMAFAACGGSDEDSEGNEDFLAQADAICEDAARDFVAVLPETPPQSAEEQLAFLEPLVEDRRQALEGLEALDPPDELADDYQAFLDEREQAIALLEDEVALNERGVTPDQPDYQKLITDQDEQFDATNEAAAEVGLQACANQLSPEEEDEVKEVTSTFETEGVEDCTDYLTDRAIEALFGGLDECQRQQENPPPEGFTEAVEFEDVTGIDGVVANARATLEGGINDGDTVEYGVIAEDGTYKIDNVFLVTDR